MKSYVLRGSKSTPQIQTQGVCILFSPVRCPKKLFTSAIPWAFCCYFAAFSGNPGILRFPRTCYCHSATKLLCLPHVLRYQWGSLAHPELTFLYASWHFGGCGFSLTTLAAKFLERRMNLKPLLTVPFRACMAS